MSDDNDVVIRFLKERGYSETDIQRVIKKLEEYEDKTLRQSVFDSIDSGGFNIDQIIQDALND